MRIAAALSPIRAISFIPRTRLGESREDSAPVPVPAHLAVTPLRSSAAYLAQTLAQELTDDPLLPAYHCVAAYVPKPSAAFEGLNFRAFA